VFILFCLLIAPAAAKTVDWKITPENPVVGDTLKITGTAAPNSDIRAEVTYIKELDVSKGRYQLSLKNLRIPAGENNLFTVRAEKVKNLHVGVNKWLTYDINRDATNGVASISQGHVPALSYNILIDGDALKGKSSVPLTITAAQTLKADSKGKFSFRYDTSALPAGKFIINIGNKVKTIELRAKPKPPQAEFTASPLNGVEPLKVKFSDQSTGSPNKWKWEFGDGKNSYEQNPEHTYRDAGRYTVSLTVWNSAGSSKITKSYFIYVRSKLKPPKADFTAAAVSGKVPLKVAFTDKSSGIITWRKWDFGDRTSSSSSNPEHTYKAAGKYLVSLTVGNPAGSHTVKKYVTVNLRRH
jgi:PKD repeat protein